MPGFTEALGIEAVVLNFDLIQRKGDISFVRNLLSHHGVAACECSDITVAGIKPHNIAGARCRRRAAAGGILGEDSCAQAEHQKQNENQRSNSFYCFHLLSPPCFFLCLKPSTASTRKSTPLAAMAR